jgi:acyl-CoA synthetase (AMP-forming)/AMP-acid ligase II
MNGPEHAQRSGDNPTGLGALLAQGSAIGPDGTAVRSADDEIRLSFTQLIAAGERVADGLGQLGVEPGDVVGVSTANTIEFVLSLVGARSLGAVVAPLDPLLARAEIDTRLGDVRARALIVAASGSPLDPSVVSGAPVLELRLDRSSPGFETSLVPNDDRSVPLPPPLDPRPLPAGCELIMFTAGTTGRSKAVPWTAANVEASITGIIDSLQLTADDATVLVMPLYHGHGLMAGLLATLATGGTATLPSLGRFSAHRFWDEMVSARATWYTAAPTIHEILVARAAQEFPGPDAVRLRMIRSCSAPLAASVASSIEAAFGAPIVSAYGMTETAHQAASTAVRDGQVDTALSVGVPTSVEMRIAGRNGAEAGVGVDGEVWVRGPALTAGYLNDDEANKESFVDGWFRTGDVGHLDADGYLYLTGRIKELIDRGGEKVAPAAVEAVLLSNPAVLDAAVFGVPDDTYGERVEAAVTLKPGQHVTEPELRDDAKTRLSAAEVPDRILLLDQLPHTVKGAPDRRALVAAAMRDTAGPRQPP